MSKENKEQELIQKEERRVEAFNAKAKSGVKAFKREFKKEMSTAVLAAFGFLIALVWKDVITNFVNNLSEKSPLHGALVSAIGVTIICVLGIMLFSRIFKEKD